MIFRIIWYIVELMRIDYGAAAVWQRENKLNRTLIILI